MILRRYYLGDRAGVSNVPHSLMRRRGHGRVRPQRGSRQASERKPDEDEERRDVRNAENRGNAGLSRNRMLALFDVACPTEQPSNELRLHTLRHGVTVAGIVSWYHLRAV